MKRPLRAIRVWCRRDVEEKTYELEFAGRSQRFREGIGGVGEASNRRSGSRRWNPLVDGP